MRTNTKNRTIYTRDESAFIRACGVFCAMLLVSVQLFLPIAPIFAAETDIVSTEGPVVVSEAADGEIEAEEAEVEVDAAPLTDTTPALELSTEEQVPSEEESIEPVTREEVVTVDSSTDVEQAVSDALVQSTDVVSDEIATLSEVNDNATDLHEEVIFQEQPTESEEMVESALDDQVTGEDVPPLAEPGEATDQSEPSDDTETTEEQIPSATETATTTVVQAELHTVTTDGNFSFSDDECIAVGDGSFYCARPDVDAEVTNTDRVFAAQDQDGDREIYIEKAGKLAQITANLTDDDMPFYDERSDTIVWHRLVDERYQIVSYDLSEESETTLTSDRYNNMQPSRYGEVTVWQGWVGNDWEIMKEESGEISMLTDNTTHDIAPNVNGDYIIWQAFDGAMWHVKVYDRHTGNIETIEDSGATSLENPRFVLVYDAKNDNGDVETRGYDLKSKEIIPLSSTPASVPESLPDPEQTGEDRAFVTQQVQIKVKVEDEQDPDALDTSTVPSDSNDTHTTSSTDIVVPSVTPESPATTSVEAETDISASTAHISDLEVTSIPVVDSQPHPDLIVTPYIEPIASTTDPQPPVAGTL